jgi:hypothetical protein
MNDFTKEELVMLKRLTLQHVNQFRENSDCIELMRKIQSMIDNYQEDIPIHVICNECMRIVHE